MTKQRSEEMDQRVDRALREILTEAPVPTLSHNFRERLSAEIERPPQRPRRRANVPRRLLFALVVLYVLVGVLGAPWLVGRLGDQAFSTQATMLLLTAAAFLSLAAVSLALVSLRRLRG